MREQSRWNYANECVWRRWAPSADGPGLPVAFWITRDSVQTFRGHGGTAKTAMLMLLTDVNVWTAAWLKRPSAARPEWSSTSFFSWSVLSHQRRLTTPGVLQHVATCAGFNRPSQVPFWLCELCVCLPRSRNIRWLVNVTRELKRRFFRSQQQCL